MNENSDTKTIEMIEAPETLGDATHSFEDNKLRFYPNEWLDKSIWEEFKALGFRSAPKQRKDYAGCFVAPCWTPKREDLCLKYADQIEDEDMTLDERAALRVERFDQYSGNAEGRAQEAYESARRTGDMIPFAQPILVGHHSERSHRRDLKRIEANMRRSSERGG